MSGTVWDLFILVVKVVGVFAALMVTVDPSAGLPVEKSV